MKLRLNLQSTESRNYSIKLNDSDHAVQRVQFIEISSKMFKHNFSYFTENCCYGLSSFTKLQLFYTKKRTNLPCTFKIKLLKLILQLFEETTLNNVTIPFYNFHT